MPTPAFDLSHASATPSLFAKARLEATAVKTRQSILKIAGAHVYKYDGEFTLEIDVMSDNTDSGTDLCTLYIQSRKCPAAAWRDQPVIEQLAALTGQKFRSFPDLAFGLVGLRFMATLACPRVPTPYGKDWFEDLVAASPVLEATNAPAR